MGVWLVKLGSRWAGQLTIQRDDDDDNDDDDDVAYARREGVEGAAKWARCGRGRRGKGAQLKR